MSHAPIRDVKPRALDKIVATATVVKRGCTLPRDNLLIGFDEQLSRTKHC
jgi:hypothetical protein